MVLVADRQRQGEEDQPDVTENGKQIPPHGWILEHVAHHHGVDREDNHHHKQNVAKCCEGLFDPTINEGDGVQHQLENPNTRGRYIVISGTIISTNKFAPDCAHRHLPHDIIRDDVFTVMAYVRLWLFLCDVFHSTL